MSKSKAPPTSVNDQITDFAAPKSSKTNAKTKTKTKKSSAKKK
jgi:hypothetical protein